MCMAVITITKPNSIIHVLVLYLRKKVKKHELCARLCLSVVERPARENCSHVDTVKGYLRLCSAPMAFKQRGFFIVPHFLWHGNSVFAVSSEGPPQLRLFYDKQGQRGPILTRIHTCTVSS